MLEEYYKEKINKNEQKKKKKYSFFKGFAYLSLLLFALPLYYFVYLLAFDTAGRKVIYEHDKFLYVKPIDRPKANEGTNILIPGKIYFVYKELCHNKDVTGETIITIKDGVVLELPERKFYRTKGCRAYIFSFQVPPGLDNKLSYVRGGITEYKVNFFKTEAYELKPIEFRIQQ